MHSFDWNLIRSFLAALDSGSLLGASRLLGTSQPTVGRHISELEAQLGQVLFERTGRGLAPTEAAHRLAQAARAMSAGADALARAATGEDASEGGSVRLSASQPIACVLLPPILAQMRRTLPHIQVELVVSNAVSNLLKREADIALRMLSPEQSSLIAKRIGQVTIGAYAGEDYLRRRGVPRTVADIVAHEFIGGDRMTQVQDGMAAQGVRLPEEQFVLRSDDLIAHWQATRAGIGIGFIADYLARADGTLTRVLPEVDVPSLPLWLVVHREIRSSPRIRAVYDFLSRAVPKAL
jgi:DNA-binding transcriptional LysR family regulator